MELHKPVFLIVAGPNGAGKTTLCESPRFLRRMGEWFDTGHFINPDKIALAERALDPRLSIPGADLLAAEKVEQATERYLSEKTSVLVETVLSSDKYKRFWTMAGEYGFERHLIYIGLDSPEISVQRVRNRASLGGHDVPEDRLRSRFDRSLDNLAWFAKEADRHLLLNGGLDYLLTAFGTRERMVVRDRRLPWIEKVFHEFEKVQKLERDTRYKGLGL